MENCISLDDINPGERAMVKELKSKGTMRRRMLDIGITENTIIECVSKSPLGDPKAFLIRGAVIAIRSDDCKDISVKSL